MKKIENAPGLVKIVNAAANEHVTIDGVKYYAAIKCGQAYVPFADNAVEIYEKGEYET